MATFTPLRPNPAPPALPLLGLGGKPMVHPIPSPRIRLRDFGREPFRIFFPAAVLAGIVGVSLWPLYFAQVTSFYPGLGHARIMACGFFGAFIFGFLGTAMPRMLSAPPLRVAEVFPLVLLHAAMVGSFAGGWIFLGDALFLTLLCGFTGCLLLRARQRKDIPPPGFVLVGLALTCVFAGSVLSLLEHAREIDPFWVVLQRLLLYQGFVLLPILGIGPFLLPRFFGLPTPDNFPETLLPDRAWLRKAGVALAAGLLIIASFIIEARAFHRLAYGLRFGVILTYFIFSMPFHRAPKASNPLGAAIRLALVGIVAGFLAVALSPVYRVALLHLTLIGGFAVITLTVATRVVFGHSGNLALLKGRNCWLLVSIGLMLFGMATRISGDFLPRILPSHYTYGAILWIGSVLVWAYYVLPKVLVVDPE